MVNRFTYEPRRTVYLREWIRAKGWNQQKLADEMDLDKGVISKWIKEPWRLNLDALSAIADALGMKDAGLLFSHPNRLPSRERFNELRKAAETILNSTPE